MSNTDKKDIAVSKVRIGDIKHKAIEQLTPNEKKALIKHKKKLLLAAKKRHQTLINKRDETIRMVESYEKDNKILYLNKKDKGHLGANGKWELNEPQKQLIEAFSTGKYNTFTYTGANRIGKTFISFILIYSILVGRFPWEWEDDSKEGWIWDLYGWRNQKIKIRWIGQDWTKHIATVLIPKIDELWPKSRPLLKAKNQQVVYSFFVDETTGNTLEIMSVNQDESLFEGWSGMAVFFDEPPPRGHYIAIARGLIDTKGICAFFCTLLKQAWLDKDIINATLDDGTPDPTVYNCHADITANIGHGISQRGVDDFAKRLTEEEKDARLKGIPSYKSGLILNIDKSKHILERPSYIPHDWIVNISIDYHPNKKQHILFEATDRHNLKYLIFEIVGHGDGTWIGEQIIDKILRYKLRINRIIIDPLSKGDGNNENTVYAKVETVLFRYGYMLETATKSKSDGIILINNLLWTPNKIPAYFIYRDMPVTIRQLTNWMFDSSGKPSKEDDDMCENAYRLALISEDYWLPEDEEDDYKPQKRGTGNKVTGY